jgi:20S proteasome alpha/beta subunit
LRRLTAVQGSFFAWKAAAVGKNMVNAKTFLEKRYSDDLELEDAIHNAILTLKVCLLHILGGCSCGMPR